ncbi:hypothetical protein L596_000476 [Steinernema carpocapsae]|uniref:Peptidase M13 C-terminal domain-containing protein n=1 Tax=Steinernema carpocapsae TaxID=34508 RepID=A0A4U8UII1_STECR|nr:hypothetical protein L596_000476 [Steinernema carpocapsae]
MYSSTSPGLRYLLRTSIFCGRRSHPNETGVENAKKLEGIMTDVREAINDHVQSSRYYTAAQKLKAKELLESLKMIMGFTEEYRNLTFLQDLHAQYVKHVLTDISPYTCNLNLIIQRISTFHHQRLVTGEPMVIPGLEIPFEPPILDQNALYSIHNGLFYVFPGNMFPLQQDYPVGFKYGFIAWTIGHEMFHGLGLFQDKEEDTLGVTNQTHFQEALKCYEDYFGSSQFCTDEGKTCANGKIKAEEGHCDIESFRVVFSVFKKALQQEDARKKGKRSIEERQRSLFDSPPVEEFFADGSKTFAQEKWFFRGCRCPRVRTSREPTE